MPLRWKNSTNETVPAFGVVRVTGTTTQQLTNGESDNIGIPCAVCAKPDASDTVYMVNGPSAVAAGKFGDMYQDGFAWALWGDSAPAFGDEVGPDTDWKLHSAKFGFVVWMYDSTSGRVLVQINQHTKPRKFYKTIAGPGMTAYPAKSSNPNVYYAQRVEAISFSKTVGKQTLGYTDTTIYDYVFNLEPKKYIEVNSIVLCFREYGQWFTIDKVLDAVSHPCTTTPLPSTMKLDTDGNLVYRITDNMGQGMGIAVSADGSTFAVVGCDCDPVVTATSGGSLVEQWGRIRVYNTSDGSEAWSAQTSPATTDDPLGASPVAGDGYTNSGNECSGVLCKVCYDSGGNLVAVGCRGIYKYDPTGELLWRVERVNCFAVAVDSSDNIWVTGQVQNSGEHAWKYDPDGVLLVSVSDFGTYLYTTDLTTYPSACGWGTLAFPPFGGSTGGTGVGSDPRLYYSGAYAISMDGDSPTISLIGGSNADAALLGCFLVTYDSSGTTTTSTDVTEYGVCSKLVGNHAAMTMPNETPSSALYTYTPYHTVLTGGASPQGPFGGQVFASNGSDFVASAGTQLSMGSNYRVPFDVTNSAIVKLDSSLVPQWIQGFDNYGQVADAAMDSSGNIYTCGHRTVWTTLPGSAGFPLTLTLTISSGHYAGTYTLTWGTTVPVSLSAGSPHTGPIYGWSCEITTTGVIGTAQRCLLWVWAFPRHNNAAPATLNPMLQIFIYESAYDYYYAGSTFDEGPKNDDRYATSYTLSPIAASWTWSESYPPPTGSFTVTATLGP